MERVIKGSDLTRQIGGTNFWNSQYNKFWVPPTFLISPDRLKKTPKMRGRHNNLLFFSILNLQLSRLFLNQHHWSSSFYFDFLPPNCSVDQLLTVFQLFFWNNFFWNLTFLKRQSQYWRPLQNWFICGLLVPQPSLFFNITWVCFCSRLISLCSSDLIGALFTCFYSLFSWIS